MTSLLEELETRKMRLGAVVLCGGKARRMGGVDKGLVQLGGKPMVQWVLDTVRTQVHTVVLNANRNQAQYGELNVEVIADEHTGFVGPLAGLSAAMHALDTDFVFMCPCDSPFVQSWLVDVLGLAALRHGHDIAVANDGDRMQPVFCIAKRSVLPSLDAYLLSGERKIDRWYAECKTVEVDCNAFADSFRNINTDEERLQAEQELLQ